MLDTSTKVKYSGSVCPNPDGSFDVKRTEFVKTVEDQAIRGGVLAPDLWMRVQALEPQEFHRWEGDSREYGTRSVMNNIFTAVQNGDPIPDWARVDSSPLDCVYMWDASCDFDKMREYLDQLPDAYLTRRDYIGSIITSIDKKNIRLRDSTTRTLGLAWRRLTEFISPQVRRHSDDVKDGPNYGWMGPTKGELYDRMFTRTVIREPFLYELMANKPLLQIVFKKRIARQAIVALGCTLADSHPEEMMSYLEQAEDVFWPAIG